MKLEKDQEKGIRRVKFTIIVAYFGCSNGQEANTSFDLYCKITIIVDEEADGL